ncbi:hypothetical protein BDN70DRAFT_899013 [Pholiota conissans]|uniref:Uncharacterized protein n=1 Tax=Pholiota conissans TaxID=109636 RepID=A0A9P6CVP1_9AGAR|nr:hypothetical protein BDN70DRAFT_899013 [Pholiota conissans]
MNPLGNLVAPELELRLLDLLDPKVQYNDRTHNRIQIDLLSITPERSSFHKNMGTDELSVILMPRGEEPLNIEEQSTTNVFFVTDPFYGDSEERKAGDARPPLNCTALHLHQQLGVPLLLFEHMSPSLEYRSSGTGFYTKYNDKDDIVSLDGICHLSQGLDDRPAYIWFSYGVLASQTATYVIYNCAANAKRLITTCAQRRNPRELLRPFAVDLFLIDDMLETWTVKLSKFRTKLITYEEDHALFSQTSVHLNALAVAELHSLSQNLNVVVGNLVDYKHRNEFFLSARDRYLSLSRPHFDVAERSLVTVTDSLGLMTSRATVLMNWAANYNARTKIRINMFFNLTTQGDSRTNLDIARLTTKIAVSSQKDSSSMITYGDICAFFIKEIMIAAVTMFFLPGSFVCAVFSMVFFDSHPGNAGRMELSVAPQWWLFPLVTIPLTIIVFLVWVIWRRRRISALRDVEVRVQPVAEDASSSSTYSIEKLGYST